MSTCGGCFLGCQSRESGRKSAFSGASRAGIRQPGRRFPRNDVTPSLASAVIQTKPLFSLDTIPYKCYNQIDYDLFGIKTYE